MALAKEQFNSYFDYAIRDLIHMYPEDAKNEKDGSKFWSGPKRFPQAVKFDANNAAHINFIVSMANLIAFALG